MFFFSFDCVINCQVNIYQTVMHSTQSRSDWKILEGTQQVFNFVIIDISLFLGGEGEWGRDIAFLTRLLYSYKLLHLYNEGMKNCL